MLVKLTPQISEALAEDEFKLDLQMHVMHKTEKKEINPEQIGISNSKDKILSTICKSELLTCLPITVYYNPSLSVEGLYQFEIVSQVGIEYSKLIKGYKVEVH